MHKLHMQMQLQLLCAKLRSLHRARKGGLFIQGLFFFFWLSEGREHMLVVLSLPLGDLSCIKSSSNGCRNMIKNASPCLGWSVMLPWFFLQERSLSKSYNVIKSTLVGG